jgi:hypothetical protein
LTSQAAYQAEVDESRDRRVADHDMPANATREVASAPLGKVALFRPHRRQLIAKEE